MWANTCWGFLGLSVAFSLARLAMIWTVGHEEWGARLLCAAGISFVLSMICFLWPLIKRRIQLSSIQPDMPISDVIDYLVNDSSVKLKKSQPPEFDHARRQVITYKGAEHQDARERIQTALNNGNIKSWGQRELMSGSVNFESSLRPIEQNYWKSACVHPLFCFHKTNTLAQTGALPYKTVELYTNLMLNKKEVKSFWAPSLWRKIFQRERLTYWDNLTIYLYYPLDKANKRYIL
jgi:hypothetical protein